MTHISYKLAKALKEFCPDLPEPMEKNTYNNKGELLSGTWPDSECFSFQLHDILSKEFCEKMAKKIGLKGKPFTIVEMLLLDLANAYYKGKLPAVEKALFEMMEGK